MSKVPRSFTIPEDLDELLRQEQGTNWSGVVTTFLQEYAASGKGTEAAIAVRLEQVENELEEARGRVDRLERERDRLQAAIDDRQADRRETFEAFDSLDITKELTPSNPVVQRHAERLGMTPEVFLAKYREWGE